jgi:hypothetical protein
MILCVIPNVSLLVHSCLPGCLIFLFQIEMPLQKKIETVWNEQMLPVIHIHAVLNLN